VNTKFEVKP